MRDATNQAELKSSRKYIKVNGLVKIVSLVSSLKLPRIQILNKNYHFKSVSSEAKALSVRVKCNNEGAQAVEFEIDIGAAITLIPEEVFQIMCPNTPLQPNKCGLVTAKKKDTIIVKGETSVDIVYNGKVEKKFLINCN